MHIRIPHAHGLPPLGRHIEHDPRSRAYALDDVVRSLDVQPGSWDVYVPVLDQGNVGACVGFATDAAIGTGPIYRALSGDQQAMLSTNAMGFQFYAWATEEDGIPGTWRTDGSGEDTGSTGLGGAKAAQKHGFIKGYLHAFSISALAKSLQLAPVIVGTNWYESMFYPDALGQVSITSRSSIAGGHEYLIYGVEKYGTGYRFLAQNSWGTAWGVKGRFWLSDATLSRLLSEQGDVTQFVPLDKPAPSPTPTPDPVPGPVAPPTADDLKLWADMKSWAAKKGLA